MVQCPDKKNMTKKTKTQLRYMSDQHAQQQFGRVTSMLNHTRIVRLKQNSSTFVIRQLSDGYHRNDEVSGEVRFLTNKQMR